LTYKDNTGTIEPDPV